MKPLVEVLNEFIGGLKDVFDWEAKFLLVVVLLKSLIDKL